MRSVGVEPTNVRLFRSLSTARPITQNQLHAADDDTSLCRLSD
nr:MAG TPA: hypothetical protein [Caudoviricetes sp.]